MQQSSFLRSLFTGAVFRLPKFQITHFQTEKCKSRRYSQPAIIPSAYQSFEYEKCSNGSVGGSRFHGVDYRFGQP